MKFGKRQLVLATLVLFLGAAVYLSWMLSDEGTLLSTNALTSKKPSEEYGAAQYVNAEGEDEEIYDIDDVMHEISDEAKEVSCAQTKLADARLSRQQARDSASDILNSLLENQNLDAEGIKSAADKACEIADTVLLESNIESLIKAKGYNDCVVVLEDDSCNVIVEITKEMQSDAVIIKDIVSSQTDISSENIKIVNVN